MVVKLNNEKKGQNIPIYDERVILFDDGGDENDRYCYGANSGSRHGTHVVRFDKDSYVIVFAGRRGGGKTTAMSWVVVKACALYNCRLVANYPIEFYIRRFRPDGKSYLSHYINEPFDFEKIICEGESYKHALLALDEAPDVISHMASQSYKNRLVSAFVRQLRKNYNTLLMGAQSEDWIDKSMRWQVDIRIDCRDVSRVIGEGSGLSRGECLELTWYDESGQWTGKTTEERINQMRYGHGEHAYVLQQNLFPRLFFGDDDTKPLFDSWYQIDILDSLRKVDLRLSSIKIGDNASDSGDKYPVSPSVLRRSLESIELVLSERDDFPAVFQDVFYAGLGGLGDADKNNLGKVLSKFNVERDRDSSNGKRWLGFGSFDIEGFRGYVEARLDRGDGDGESD